MTGSQHHHGHPTGRAPAVRHGRHPHQAAQHEHHERHRHPARKGSGRRRWTGLRRGFVRFLRRPFLRRLFWGTTVLIALATVAVLGLWWRLNSGPIELDMATPWLKAAIEQNLGANETVAVGGTQIERDEKGRTSLRLRDIVVRDADGTVVASAPKAEVGLSGASLLLGKVRAQSLNLVGAEMAVRIESDGSITVFAGDDKRPIATASPAIVPAAPPTPSADTVSPPKASPRAAFKDVAGIMAWLDSVGESGLDGHDLRELGLKNGSLVVDDRRNGKRWTFSRINASLTRPAQGGVVFRIESVDPDRPWVLSAAMRPLADGIRAVGLEARKVSTRDIMLALRLDQGGIDVNMPISASIRADIASDGTPRAVQGQFFTGPGTIVDRDNAYSRIEVQSAPTSALTGTSGAAA